MSKKLLQVTVVLGVLILGFGTVATPAFGSLIVTGSSGSRSAEAEFDLIGSALSVTLTNTSASDVLIPIDVLTALFFTAAGDPAFSLGSAVLDGASTVFFAPLLDAFGIPIVGGTYAGGDVGAEWAYNNALSGPLGANQGISSTGLTLFGPGDRFDTVGDLQKPASPDGLQYGLTSAGDNPLTGNTPVTGQYALIQDSVLFTFIVPSGFGLGDISGVSFQYGTALDDPNVPGSSTPEPASLVLLGLGLGGLVIKRVRKAL